MKTRNETINELYLAWTQGGYPEVYADRAECRDWLEGLVTEDDPDGYFRLSELTDAQRSELAEEICGMYDKSTAKFFEGYGEIEWLEPEAYYKGGWSPVEKVGEDDESYDIVVNQNSTEYRYTNI